VKHPIFRVGRVKPVEKKTQQLSVKVEIPLMEAIDEIAVSEHRTRAAFIKHVLLTVVEQKQQLKADKAS